MAEEAKINDIVKTMIEAQIVATLNSAPEAIEKLVKAALSKEVDVVTGKSDGYYGSRVPYLDYLVGDEIRMATRDAVKRIIKEENNVALIEGMVREGLSSQSIVDAIVKSFVGTAEQDWKITVKFEGEKERR